MIIIVTGTPGTGKTTVSQQLAKSLTYEYIDVHQVIIDNKLDSERDEERDCIVVDTEKLNEILIETIEHARSEKKGLVIDSHLSHEIPPEYVDCCIVTICELKQLESRLLERGYHKEKIRENIDAEIFETCKTEAQDNGHTIFEVDTTKEINYSELISVLTTNKV